MKTWRAWIPILIIIAVFFVLIAVDPVKADEVLFRCVDVQERAVRQFDPIGTPTGEVTPTWIISMTPYREPGAEIKTLFGTVQIITTDPAIGTQFREDEVYAVFFDYRFTAPPRERLLLQPVQ